MGAVEEAASLRVRSYIDKQLASAERNGWSGAGGRHVLYGTKGVFKFDVSKMPT